MEHDTKCNNAVNFSDLCLWCITEYEQYARERETEVGFPEPE